MPFFKRKEKEKKKGLRQRSGCTFLLVVVVVLAFAIIGLLIRGTIIEPPVRVPPRIVYSTTSNEIYSMEMDGSDRRKLPIYTSKDSFARYEFGEAAADKVVFLERSYGYDIYMVDKDGTNRRTLTDGSGTPSLPSLSPDGKYVTYELLPASGTPSQIIIADADGSNKRVVATLTDVGGDRSPHWFPDSQHILYTTGGGGERVTYKVSIDGQQTRFRLPESAEREVVGIRISPDGQKLAFTVFEGGGYMLYTCKIDNTGLQCVDLRALGEMVIQPGDYIVWTPDSQYILYLPWTFFPEYGGYSLNGIWITNPDGSEKRQLINDNTILTFTLLR